MTATITSKQVREPSDSDTTAAAQGYIVPNAWEHARRRLELLEACYDHTSFSRARALGVGEGWRCLDAGAGGGSFARWLSAQVGPAGSVVAADLDTRLLQGIDAPNLEIREIDLVTDDLPSGQFDFVHTRLVLMHIPQRERVLQRLCEALRPGGTLMLEEADVFPILAAGTGRYRDAWLAFRRAYLPAGTNDEWARDLPARLARRGLTDVDVELDIHRFRGGSTEAQFWSLTWEQVRDRVTAVGEPTEVIDHGRTELTNTERWFQSPAVVIATGRRPPK